MADTKRTNQGGVGGFSRATGGFKRGGSVEQDNPQDLQTNQATAVVNFRSYYSTSVIAIGVGVAAFFIIKKVK